MSELSALKGFQYAVRRGTEFIFVRWVRVEPVVAEVMSS